MAATPKNPWPVVKAMLPSVHNQSDPASVNARFDRPLVYVEAKLPEVFAHLDGARADILAFTGFPKDVWQQAWPNNSNEHLNREIRRRTDMVGTFPNRDAITPPRGICAGRAKQ